MLGGQTSSTRPSTALANSPLPPPATAHPQPVITEDNVSILPLFCFLKAVLTQGAGVGRCHPVFSTLGTLKTFQPAYWEIKWLESHLLASQEDHSTSDWRAAPPTRVSSLSTPQSGHRNRAGRRTQSPPELPRSDPVQAHHQAVVHVQCLLWKTEGLCCSIY